MAAAAVQTMPQTPPEYFRITSDTLKIPAEPEVSIPVGILACQRDPLLFELATTVVSSSPHVPAAVPAANQKKAKKGAPAPPAAAPEPTLEVLLHDTIIFPEGGGQPTDVGTLLTEDGTLWQVTQCRRHGGHAVHYVKVKDTTADASHFAPGAKVVVSLGPEGFKRRYDHMTMHTGQHLLSALLEVKLNLPTLAWSLTSWPQPCYIEVSRAMKPEELELIQDEANKLVLEGRTCHVEVQELDKAGPPQGRTEATATSGWSGKAMPADYTGGVNRLVYIDGVDRTPCCGTHLPTLNNLQVYIFPQTESIGKGSARLHFLTGPRLVHHLSTSHTWLTQAAQTLSAAPAGVPERVASVLEEKVRATKRVSELEEELAQKLAAELGKEIAAADGKLYAKHIHRTDDGNAPLPLLTAIANGLPPSGPHLIILSSAPTIQSAASSSVVLVFGNDEKQVKAVGEAFKSELGMKGGGKGPRWSGKGSGVFKSETAQKILDSVAGVSA